MSADTRILSRAVVFLASAILLGGCAHTSAPAAPAGGDLEPRMTLVHLDEQYPDVRLTLNQEAYVALIMINPQGVVYLLDQRGSATSKHYGQGVHFFRSYDVFGRTNMPIRVAPRAGQEIRNFRHSREIMYMVVATAVPLDLHQAVEGGEWCGFAATDHAALMEELEACLLGDGEVEAGVAVASWPSELVEAP